MLWERVTRAPAGMNELFASMLGKVDEVHKKSLAFYLQALGPDRPDYFTSICNLTAANMEGEIISYEAFRNLCRRTEIQIVAQSAGILEVHKHTGSPWGPLKEDMDLRSFWEISPIKVLRSVNHHRQEMSSREVHFGYTPYPEMLDYESLGISWIHRSAYDFFFGPNAEAWKTHAIAHPDPEETTDRLWKGALKHLRAAPSCDSGDLRATSFGTLVNTRLGYLVHAGIRLSRNIAEMSEYMDELRLSVAQLLPEDFPDSALVHSLDSEHQQSIGMHYFLARILVALEPMFPKDSDDASKLSLWKYIADQVDSVIGNPTGVLSLAAIEFFAAHFRTSTYSENVVGHRSEDSAMLLTLGKLLQLVHRRFCTFSKGDNEDWREPKLIHSRRNVRNYCALPSHRAPLEAELDKDAMTYLADAFQGWYKSVGEVHNDPVHYDRPDQLRITCENISVVLDEIAKAVDLHFPIRVGKFWFPDVLFQISAELWKAACFSDAGLSLLMKVDETGNYVKGLRVNFVQGNAENWPKIWYGAEPIEPSFVSVKISMHTAAELFDVCRNVNGFVAWEPHEYTLVDADFEKIAEALTQDINANEQGLTEEDRRRALSCIDRARKNKEQHRTRYPSSDESDASSESNEDSGTERGTASDS